ncbi:hypothetical protein Srufu_079210 (plasmid) [Streptomyces libani subsp. rufus]|nr:hypothetical protein Srufu_079210 [Streptomyces libani subsp. rufus]
MNRPCWEREADKKQCAEALCTCFQFAGMKKALWTVSGLGTRIDRVEAGGNRVDPNAGEGRQT